MPGIYVMAMIAAAAAAVLIGGPLLLTAARPHRAILLLLVLVELPMSAAVFLFVRQPIDLGIRSLGLGPGLYGFIASWYAPLIEEPAKLLPLVVPLLFRRVSSANAVSTGLALGLGFGLGEIGFIAWLISQNPQVAVLPWHVFTGFLVERILVCFLHGAFTAIAVWLWCRGARWGIAVAMLLHYLLNFPIYLGSLHPFGLDRLGWVLISMAWVAVLAIAMAITLVYLRGGRARVRLMLGGTRSCPGCGARYRPTVVGLNLLVARYERCPHCRKWHLV
jgi:hypothetical protein